MAFVCISPSIGVSQAESEQLLRETHEAMEAKLDFSGVRDVRQMLEALEQGRALHPLHLTAIADTLEAVAELEAHLLEATG